jgi:hypothetical protein
VLSSAYAHAVSDNVRQACRDDYYRHCSQYSVGTEELRQCMRKVGEGLSAPCLVALVQEGEITKEDVERHNAAKGGKSSAKNIAGDAGAKAADDPKDVSKKNEQKKKVAKTAVAADPPNAKKVSKKVKTGSKAPPEKPVKTAAKKANKNIKKTKIAVSANANPGGANKGAAKSVSTGKNKKSVTKPAAANPSAKKASSKKKATRVPEERAP